MTVPKDDTDSLPARIGGKYRPLRLIGRGGMGAVYEVEHEHTGQRLALKVIASTAGLTPRAVSRFRTEARTAAQIRSDHVVRITDADVATELGGLPFLVMELLEGADLEEVTQGSPAKPSDVVEWLRQVARGLAKAHAMGVVHRDLKPENLFLTTRDDGTPLVKILDFGVAKVIEEGAAQTRSGQIVGTPLYMAPEQAAASDEPISPRTDGFALGLIAFRLLVGRSYWRPGTIVQLVSQATLEPMAPASERGATFGPAFDAWFAKACARNASERFDGPREQVEALAEAFGVERLTLSSPSRRRISLPARSASLEMAQTLAASGNVAISGAHSSGVGKRGRSATAALAGMAAVGVAVLVAAALVVRRNSVVVVADGASISTASSSVASPESLPGPLPAPPAPIRVATPEPPAIPVTTPQAVTADAGVEKAVRPVPPSRPHVPGRKDRDPLEDQN